MYKDRVNWTISNDCICLLKQAKKLNGSKTSLSSLVEFAIRKTYRNQLEFHRLQMREHQKKLMIHTDKVRDLEEAAKK